MLTLQSAQLTVGLAVGASGKIMLAPFTSASKVGPWADDGSEKFSESPKITGYDSRTILLISVLNTSACRRNVLVSDQFKIDTDIVRPPCEKPSEVTFVKGHGPAMQDNRAFS